MALILTLSVIVLLTIIVVSFATTARLDRAESQSNFEQKRAQALALVAVDEVVGKLRDNIPLDAPWSVGPGALYCQKTPGSTTPVTVPLHSGAVAGATHGTVALNRQNFASTTNYTVVSPNADYPTPDAMQVAWINVLQDGTRSTDPDYTTRLNASTNPIVGRYAYWADIETGKANLNTAGYAATGPLQLHADTQIYSGQPDRVDLSLLDPAAQVSNQSSLDTFVYHSGAQLSSTGGRYNPPYRPGTANGLNRYNSIDEWVRTPSATSSALSGITPAQVIANQFYLTTRARAPELNPWGLNKVWWTVFPPQSNVSGNPPGDQMNSPYYDAAISSSPYSAFAPHPRYSYENPDNRYYVYPWAAHDWDEAGQGVAAQPGSTADPTRPFQNFSTYSGNIVAFQQTDASFNAFFLSLYHLLERRDWPSMPGTSFVDKYGQAACENIAINLMTMADSTIGSPEGLPARCTNLARAYQHQPPGVNENTATLGRDTFGIYGLYLWKSPVTQSPTSKVRYLWGQNCAPMLNEVAMTFKPTTAGRRKKQPDFSGYPQPGGFAPAITTPNPTKCNVQMSPQAEFVWPQGYPTHVYHLLPNNNTSYDRFGTYSDVTGIVTRMTEIVVYATGTVNGQPVTYDGTTTPSNYSWRYADDRQAPNQDTRYPAPAVGFPLQTYFSDVFARPTSAPSYFVTDLPPASGTLYIGPFDVGTAVHVKISFRLGTNVKNSWLDNTLLQVAPAVAADLSGGTVDTSQMLSLTYDTEAISYTDPSVTRSLEVIDPRVYQDASDWLPCTAAAGNTLGGTNSVYVAANSADSTMDDSKLAWPPVDFITDQAGADKPAVYLSQFNTSTRPCTTNPSQTATSVTGMPGLGWLSLISTADYSKGATSEAWKTLNFGPSKDASRLPDWLLAEAFAIVYPESYCSLTDGKVNLNAHVNPFNFDRVRPLQALIGRGTSNGASIPTSTSLQLARNIATRQLSAGAASFQSNQLYVYPGEICQVAGVADGSGKQLVREALVRDILGLVTTQSSDFTVHLVSQSVKVVGTQTVVRAEYRADALLERAPDLGPDGIPGTSDDLAGPDGIVGSADDLKLVTTGGGTVSSLSYTDNDPLLLGGAGRPPFHYRVVSIKTLNQ